jgi:hypothetical protein
MFVKPAAKGLLVRDPVTKRPLDEAGREVPDTDLYWARRLAQGDVVAVASPADGSTLTGATRNEPGSVQE